MFSEEKLVEDLASHAVHLFSVVSGKQAEEMLQIKEGMTSNDVPLSFWEYCRMFETAAQPTFKWHSEFLRAVEKSIQTDSISIIFQGDSLVSSTALLRDCVLTNHDITPSTTATFLKTGPANLFELPPTRVLSNAVALGGTVDSSIFQNNSLAAALAHCGGLPAKKVISGMWESADNMVLAGKVLAAMVVPPLDCLDVLEDTISKCLSYSKSLPDMLSEFLSLCTVSKIVSRVVISSLVKCVTGSDSYMAIENLVVHPLALLDPENGFLDDLKHALSLRIQFIGL